MVKLQKADRLTLMLAAALLLSTSSRLAAGESGAQPIQEVKNPLEGDPKAIEQGMHLYRYRCAVCHGIDGRGYRASDLTSGEWTHGGGDGQLYRVISRGIPGTEMPGTNLLEDEAWMVIAYLRTLSGPGADTEEQGNAEKGEKLYWGKADCARCHFVDGRGGRLGPALSRIGAARSQIALARAIRSASEYLVPGYETVTVVTRDGRRSRGCRKNEDAFSIQIMDTHEELLTFLKKDVRQVIDESSSLMPDYGPDKLSDQELRDLLRYLGRLRGPVPGGK